MNKKYVDSKLSYSNLNLKWVKVYNNGVTISVAMTSQVYEDYVSFENSGIIQGGGLNSTDLQSSHFDVAKMTGLYGGKLFFSSDKDSSKFSRCAEIVGIDQGSDTYTRIIFNGYTGCTNPFYAIFLVDDTFQLVPPFAYTDTIPGWR